MVPHLRIPWQSADDCVPCVALSRAPTTDTPLKMTRQTERPAYSGPHAALLWCLAGLKQGIIFLPWWKKLFVTLSAPVPAP